MVRFLRKHPTVRTLVEKTDRLYRNLKDWVTIDELEVEVSGEPQTTGPLCALMYPYVRQAHQCCSLRCHPACRTELDEELKIAAEREAAVCRWHPPNELHRPGRSAVRGEADLS
jgi:hypothetical protein